MVHSSVTAALPSRSPTPQRILLWEAGFDRSTVLHNRSGAPATQVVEGVEEITDAAGARGSLRGR